MLTWGGVTVNYIVLILTGGRLRSLHVTEEFLARTMDEDGSLTEPEALRRIAAGTAGAEKVWVRDRASLPLGGAYPEAYAYTGDDEAPLGYDLEALRARRRREFAGSSPSGGRRKRAAASPSRGFASRAISRRGSTSRLFPSAPRPAARSTGRSATRCG